MHFCSSEVTGTPVSLVGWSVTLNGLRFRQRVLSIYWRLNCLSRRWKIDPGIPRHSLLKANLKKSHCLSQWGYFYLLLVGAGSDSTGLPQVNFDLRSAFCFMKQMGNVFKKKKRWYKCIKVQTIFMCCLTFSLNFYYAVFKAVRCDSAWLKTLFLCKPPSNHKNKLKWITALAFCSQHYFY